MRLKKLTIRGFRGFCDEQPIELDSNVILIYGLNGSGKSSFTEALEWLFFGEISRQRLSRCRSEYQHEEYLRNLFYADKVNPFVEVEAKIGSVSRIIRKEITDGGIKHFVDGNEVPDFSELDLNLESYFRPMLAQTEIKALVDTEQKDRWEQLSSILGQDELTRLREFLITLRNSKKDQTYKQAESKWLAIISEIEESEELKDLISPIKNRDLENLGKTLQNLTSSASCDLGVIIKKIRSQEKLLLNSELGGRISDISFGDSDGFMAFLNESKGLLTKLEGHCIAATKGGHDHKYLDFLEAGRGYVREDICPFCLANTLTQERLKSIKTDLINRETAKTAMESFTVINSKLKSWKGNIRNRAESFYASETGLKVIFQKLTSIGEDSLATEVQLFLKEVKDEINKLRKSLDTAIDLYTGYLDRTYFHKERVDKQDRDRIEEAIKQAVANRAELITRWENVKQSLSEKIPISGGIDQGEIRKWLLLEKVAVFFSGSGLFLRQFDALQKIGSIQAKLETFEKAEVMRLLIKHADEIKAYYNRLNRGEDIQFVGIEVKGGVRRQAKLKAEAFGKDVNPVTFFSEAHTNSLALSIYFPQRVDRNATWQVVILDDPVQSMDENHSQALIDILVDIAKYKQVIVLTHSKSFYRKMSARMHYLRPLTYLFYNNDDKGPQIQLDQGETSACVASIEGYIKKGDMRSLETASHLLRKAIESICIDFLLDQGLGFNKTKGLQNSGLHNLFVECEKYGLPSNEIGKLKSLLDTSHSNSHAWSIVDVTPGGLRTGTKYIKEIYDSYIK
ncbi:MAG: AAA family ATPase [Deltaproteobacteria bacterium]|nr:AAA family ATPase [Deltaproteobacteria bacterium]